MNSHVVKGAFALVLSGTMVGALSTEAASAPTAGTAAGTATVATDPVQPGVWGTATELAPSAQHRVLGLQARADGALVALRDQPQDPAVTAEVRRLTVQVRPAGTTTWAAPRTLSTAADLYDSALAPQADGSFVAHWRERLPDGTSLLKAATLAPGATNWSAPTTVATLSSWAEYPLVFGNATGRLTAVWAVRIAGGRELRMSERPAPGDTWSEPTVFDTVTSDADDGEFFLTGLHAAIDKAGNAAIAWNLDDRPRDGGGSASADGPSYHSRIMERKAGATAWVDAEDLTPLTGTQPGALRLDADPAGGLTLLWATVGGPVRFARKGAPGEAWSAVEQTPLTGWYAPAALPRPLTAPNGDVTLVGAADKAVVSTTRSARVGVWSAVEQADDRRPLGSAVSSGVATDGTVFAGWAVSIGNGSYRYVSGFHTRGGWSAPRTLATTTGNRTVGGALTVAGTRPTALWYDSSTLGGPLHCVFGTTRPLPRARDYGDDRRADVLSLSGTALTRYDGDAAGHLTAGSVHSGAVTTGWPAGTRFTGFGDLNGDRVNDVLAVLPTGEARMYETPAGRLPAPTSPYKKTSSDWRGYNVLTTPGDLTGDGRADLLARSAATGDIYLYAGNGSAGFAPRVEIRSGWKGYSRVIGAGDLNGDGHGDVLALDGSGELWRYNGTGTGKLADRVLVFRDWGKSYRQVLGADDLNGDGKADLLSVDSDGVAWLNPGTGHGTFGSRVRVGSGWSGRTLS
ncbi:FG-GAP repeat domain-containing protein [Streptomyces barringtoniae]|uniref:FG-GAP repeat domain-containing protein n=1 Tax=Streptomyces barringtoniae TaxID=2892029 RepID=UPI001E3F4BE0|nr:VCBS repeat-containing protein [Streptomyces barringtoniae]MCC5474740.1 VCBS repeat-containing protein [Streptomyces barringtoniae]